MITGTIRIDQGNLRWVDILKGIYDFEATKVAGPGSYKRDIEDVLWTIKELESSNPDLKKAPSDLINLIRWMDANRQIMIIPSEENGDRHITRVAEIVRLLGHGYEYWYEGKPGIAATRWTIEYKKFPNRSLSAEDTIKRLSDLVTTEIGSGPRFQNLHDAIELVITATAKTLNSRDWTKAKFSEFQIKATEEMILAKYKKGHDKDHQILTAGVGSGKTIGFTMGILISALEEWRGGGEKCHIFTYPRTALAKDQFGKLEKIVKNLSISAYPTFLHFEHADYMRDKYKSVRRGIETVYGSRTKWPVLIVTTLETLKRRLQQPMFARLINERLSRVVIDEIHLIQDIQGAQAVNLIQRLKSIAPEEILFTGSSATVACPEEHAAKVFGVKDTDIRIIEPKEEDMESVGLVHHVFLRPADRVSTAGCLVNSTSILTHNRRDAIGSRPSSPSKGNNIDKDVQKTIGFADNLDILGRWHADFRENERTENSRSISSKREHPSDPNVTNWNQRQREVPYALRFHNPLVRRKLVPAGIPHSIPADGYLRISAPIPTNACEECRDGKRISFGKINQPELRQLGRFVVRDPSKKDDPVKAFWITHKIFEQGSEDIGTLDLCPYLRAGACFWFPNEDFATSDIPHTNLFEYSNTARSRIYSSKVGGSKDQENEGDLVSSAFADEIRKIYGPIVSTTNKQVPVDVVFSSPSLEVGIDVENLTETMMFKAIRNVSSYRQKAGRAGREIGSDTMNVTLMSQRAIDFHYYRQPRKLISARLLDPIPLKESNPHALRQSAYMAVWDYLALRANLPESIPDAHSTRTGIPKSKFGDDISDCLDFIHTHRMDIVNHLRDVTRDNLQNAEMDSAIDKVEAELKVFLIPTAGIITGPNISCIADFVVDRLNGGPGGISNRAILADYDRLKTLDQFFDILRPKINPISLGLAGEFNSLDSMRKSGWSESGLSKVIPKLSTVASSSVNPELSNLISHLTTGEMALKSIGAHGNPLVYFFKKQFEAAYNPDTIGRAYYLSYISEDLPLLTDGLGGTLFRRQKNLFQNPFEPSVTVSGRTGSTTRDETVPITEALYSYIPGNYNHRKGYPIKVMIGGLTGSGSSLIASLSNIIGAGNSLIELKKNITGPPFFGPSYLDIYQPTVLKVAWADKYILARKSSGTIVDNDEDSPPIPSRDQSIVKIPKCHLESWTHISSDKRIDIKPFELGLGDMYLDPKKLPTWTPSDIRHPLMAHLINKIEWHENLQALEYVFSTGRSYTSSEVSGAEISFMDMTKGIEIGFGRNLDTEGIFLELNPKTFMDAVGDIADALCTFEDWSPTAVLAFRAMISQIILSDSSGVRTRINPFLAQDIVTIVVHSLGESRRTTPGMKITFPELINHIIRLSKDEDSFMEIAKDHIREKYHTVMKEITNQSQISSSESQTPEEGEIESEADRLYTVVQLISSILDPRFVGIPSLAWDYLKWWVSFTLLNTFGVAAYNSTLALCGTSEDKVGYLPDMPEEMQAVLSNLSNDPSSSLPNDIPQIMKRGTSDGTSMGPINGRFGVYIYDRDEKGNGSSETVRNFLHILYIQRSRAGPMARLPTEDFLTILEQELLQCPQFHADMTALEMYSAPSKGITGVAFPELAHVHEQATEIKTIGESIWPKLGIVDRQDAWKLPLILMTSHLKAKATGIPSDDIARASGICWHGCPECVTSDHMLMGPLRGRDFVDKAILDHWFGLGRSNTSEYMSVLANDIANGSAGLEIGCVSHLCMKSPPPKSNLRSVSLPFNIGVNIERHIIDDPRLIIRSDDIVGLRLGGVAPGRAISIGFGRLVWYDLLMTAYLDAIGKIKSDKKRIILAYFDIRDVPLDETGISEIMWGAIEHHKRLSGDARRLEYLSDLLGWLSKRGFSIMVCTDYSQSHELGVTEFLTRLKHFDPKGSSIEILTKDLPNGRMHLKMLVTPIGAIDGSANLSSSAFNSNDESINHADIGTKEYNSIELRTTDVLKGAIKWKP